MTRTRQLQPKIVAVAAAALVVAAAPDLARAEPFTFFNIEYEATTQNTSDAHFDVRSPQYMLTQPNNWRAPIDYTQGTVYIEQDVLTKPSQLDTQVDICFISTGGYGCRSTVFYKTTGRVTTMRPANSFYQFNQINWNTRINLVQLIVKDRNNTNGGNPRASFMPTRMRIAMTFVPMGDTYALPPGFAPAGGGDGGATVDAGASDAAPSPPADAAAPTPPDAVPPAPPTMTPPVARPPSTPPSAPSSTPPPPPQAPPTAMPPVAPQPMPVDRARIQRWLRLPRGLDRPRPDRHRPPLSGPAPRRPGLPPAPSLERRTV